MAPEYDVQHHESYTPGNGREPGFVVSLYYEIAQRVMDSAYLLEGSVRTLEVDRERALDMTRKGLSTMTELADDWYAARACPLRPPRSWSAGWCFLAMRSISPVRQLAGTSCTGRAWRRLG